MMLYDLVVSMRPKHWTKNLIVFAALLFSVNTSVQDNFPHAIFGFALFCAVAGSIYIFNDCIDKNQDACHPSKKERPIASGALTRLRALLCGFIVLSAALVISWNINVALTVVLCGYTLINIAYSLWLKHIVIIDVIVIAGGFVIRAVGGNVAINAHLTYWFLICTMFLALFLAVSKRRSELKAKGMSTRKVLTQYSPELLNLLNIIAASAAIVSYALYTISSGRTVQMIWTVPIAIFGIGRYWYLVHMRDKGGQPENILFEDRPILFAVIFYVLSVVLILSAFD
jgi:4-hydroxybenzoate polyprenyltransferase